jgi:GT2 family glycosyltransferase
MPPRTRRLHFPDHAVTTVLVSHDGAAWLPETLAALAAQTRAPQRVVAVDTGSTDASVDLLVAALGETAVVRRPRDLGLGAAVQAGLDAFEGAPPPPGVAGTAQEWVWVLHDDSAPDPDALARLLERSAGSPSACVLGPKAVSWDRRRLLEVGVTIDSSGFRETGLEPRELDQGQHDEVGDVLAVGTAGMLVRRDVWDSLGGLDHAWPLAGDDTDFGWRVNASGGRVLVAPRAVVRHAAALTSGRRKADALSLPAGAAARAHGMQVVLADTSVWLVLPLVVRYLVESLLRVLGALVLLRSPRRARDELLGIVVVLGRPHVVVAARRRRRHLRTRPHHDIRGLLAPAGWRLRHAGDAMAELVAGRAAREERARRRAPVETGPVAAEAESFAVDDLSVLARLLARPGVVLTVALVAFALVADRGVLGGQLHGGRLLPPPAGSADLWSLYVATWHPVGLGSTSPTPPVIAVLALLSSILLGKVWLAVDLLVLGAVPLAGLCAYLAVGVLTRRTWLRVVAAVAYAVTPAALGAVASGRVDALVAFVLAPVVVRALAAVLRRPATHRAVGAGLLLAVLTAATPVLWPVAAVTLLVALVAVGGKYRSWRRAGAVVTALAVAPLVLVPWTWRVVSAPRLLVAGAGLPDTFASHHGMPVTALLLVRPGGPAMPPTWTWVPVVVAAVVALTSPRVAARVGFLMFTLGVTGALVVSRLAPAGTVTDARYWTGPLLVIAALGALTGAVVAADEGPRALRQRAFGVRHAAAALLAVAAVGGIATCAVGWLVRGSAGPLSASTRSVLPVFAQAEAAAPTAPRILVLRSAGGAVHYTVLRGPDGLRLGDADVTAVPAAGGGPRPLAAAVADAAAGRARALDELAGLGISLVVVPTDSDGELSRLAGVVGLARVPATSTVVYRVSRPAGELVVLRDADARAAASGPTLPAAARPQPLVASPGSARVSVAAAPGTERLLVLAEPYGNRWHATLSGHPLTPTRAYGWAQAWRLPDAGGTLRVGRDGGARHLLLVVDAIILGLALLMCLPSRGRQR